MDITVECQIHLFENDENMLRNQLDDLNRIQKRNGGDPMTFEEYVKSTVEK